MAIKDRYNKSYFINSAAFQKSQGRIARLYGIINKMQPKSVLDVGCGLGNLVRKLNKEGIKAKGVDFSPVFKEFCKDDCFIEADANELPFGDNEFDLVLSTDFFEHLPEEQIDTVYNEMKRVGERVVAEIAYDIGGRLKEEWKIYHLTNKPKDWWARKLPGIIFTDPEKVEVGAGKKPHRGYLTVDLEGADINIDFRALKFRDVGVVRAHHILEHFGRDEGIQVLALWHRWLRDGGLLVVETPDFEEICKNFNKDNYWMARHAYGSQEADWAYHRDAWYEKKFSEVLPDIGFEVINIERNRTRAILPNIVVTAKK